MNDEVDPYRAPETEAGAEEAHPLEGANITTTMVDHLRETRPWVRFIATLGFVYLGIIILMGVGSAAAMLFSPGGLPGVGPLLAGGVVYIGVAVFGFFPVLYLHRYAVSLKRLLAEGGTKTLEEAMRHQRSFWKFIGIVYAVILGLVALGLVGVIVAGILSAFV